MYVKKTMFKARPGVTMKLTKPRTPEIFMDCYCVARK